MVYCGFDIWVFGCSYSGFRRMEKLGTVVCNSDDVTGIGRKSGSSSDMWFLGRAIYGQFWEVHQFQQACAVRLAHGMGVAARYPDW